MAKFEHPSYKDYRRWGHGPIGAFILSKSVLSVFVVAFIMGMLLAIVLVKVVP